MILALFYDSSETRIHLFNNAWFLLMKALQQCSKNKLWISVFIHDERISQAHVSPTLSCMWVQYFLYSWVLEPIYSLRDIATQTCNRMYMDKSRNYSGHCSAEISSIQCWWYQSKLGKKGNSIKSIHTSSYDSNTQLIYSKWISKIRFSYIFILFHTFS